MDTPCIIWPNCKDKFGYGQVRHKGKMVKAHRLAYCRHHGLDIHALNGLVIRHKCDNTSCVNPEHLETGTNDQNMADMVKRGRSPCGERNAQAKLTAAQVLEIVATYVHGSKEFGARALAEKHGVVPASITEIMTGKKWKSVTAGILSQRERQQEADRG